LILIPATSSVSLPQAENTAADGAAASGSAGLSTAAIVGISAAVVTVGVAVAVALNDDDPKSEDIVVPCCHHPAGPHH